MRCLASRMRTMFDGLSKGYLTMIFMIMVIALRTLKGEPTLEDPFHHGEYFAAAMSFFHSEKAVGLPLTIHGALDVLPAYAARFFWSEQRYFLPAYGVYKLLDFLAGVLFWQVLAYYLREKPFGKWMALVGALIAQPMIGFKDVFLLGALFVFQRFDITSTSNARSAFLKVLFGSLVGMGLFWSYDKGIAGVLSLGAATLVLLARDKSHGISIASFVLTLVLAAGASNVFSLRQYVENIRFLMDTSAQWSYGLNQETIKLISYAVYLNAVAVVIYWRGLFLQREVKARLHEALALTGLAIFMVKIGSNRADMPHIALTMWVPILLVARSFLVDGVSNRSVRLSVFVLLICSGILSIQAHNSLALVVSIFVAVCAFWRVASPASSAMPRWGVALAIAGWVLMIGYGVSNQKKDRYDWILQAISPAPNEQVVAPALRWVSQQLIDSKGHCLFDMTNSGVLNGLTGLPSCTRFTYPVYATASYEKEMIKAVAASAPPMVVYSSTHWSYSIDGKTMPMRFPALDDFLLEKYPFESCHDGYCVRRAVIRSEK